MSERATREEQEATAVFAIQNKKNANGSTVASWVPASVERPDNYTAAIFFKDGSSGSCNVGFYEDSCNISSVNMSISNTASTPSYGLPRQAF